MSLDRRGWLKAAGASLGAMWLSACDRLTQTAGVRSALQSAEDLNRGAQRLVLNRGALAKEFTEADISPDFRANGSINPSDAAYRAHVANGFADWKLIVDGLVERPLAFDLRTLRKLSPRTQITRHDCVEGWSSIGKWTGPRLATLLDMAGVLPDARYVVFHCADTLDPAAPGDKGRYYESIDLVDAYHSQTILAYAMNGRPLPVAHGAPLRLRVERQLGYKHAKYVMRIEVVSDFAKIGYGKGGFWEDRGYEWYAGL